MIEIDKKELLLVHRLPGRIDANQAADLLGFQPHDIPVLIRKKLLIPLGNPVSNAPKWFASLDIVHCSQDTEWLSRATRCISHYWKERNQRPVSQIQ